MFAFSNSFRSRWLPSLRRTLTPVGVICIIVSLLGCLAILNGSYDLDRPFHYVRRQLVWLVTAIGVLLTTTAVPFRLYRRWALFLALPVYILLWLVLVFGIRVNGMRGWFAAYGVFLQPSEIGKPVFVLCLAAVLTATEERRRRLLSGYLPALGLLAAWVVPILLEPDLGTALVYIAAFFIVMTCAGSSLIHLSATAIAALPVAGLFIWQKPYVKDRFLAFLRPEQYLDTAGWHILQFQRTLAAGGLFGSGTHEQSVKTWLPFGYSDSIFATIGEAVGFVGCVAVVAVLMAWMLYGYVRVRRADSYFSAMVIAGMVTVIGVQAFIHLSVNLGVLPPTGLPLPLISYGGSSLVATVASVGITESAAREGGTLLPCRER